MILDARVRAGWIEAPAPAEAMQAEEAKAHDGVGSIDCEPRANKPGRSGPAS